MFYLKELNNQNTSLEDIEIFEWVTFLSGSQGQCIKQFLFSYK